jgi:hypothetical protein
MPLRPYERRGLHASISQYGKALELMRCVADGGFLGIDGGKGNEKT